MRFLLQVHEVTVPIGSKKLTPADIQRLSTKFVEFYEKMYGRGTALANAEREVVRFRVSAIGKIHKPPLKAHPVGRSSAKHAIKGTRKVYFRDPRRSGRPSGAVRSGRLVNTTVFDGPSLKPGNRMEGPAIIEYPTTTVVVPPTHVAKIDKYMSVLIR